MEDQIIQQDVQQIKTVNDDNDHKTRKAAKEFMQSKDDWVKKYDEIFKGSGFAGEEEIPEEPTEEQITNTTQLVSGKKVGIMEMVKAKREYREKRKKAKDRMAIVNAYYDKIDAEEKAVQNDKAHALRDEWDLMKLIDSQEEKQAFMDDVTSNEKERVLAAMDKAFEKLRTVDFNMFTVKSEDDLYKNYEQKKRYMEAGHILKNMMEKYMKLGGVMDNGRYVEMLAVADFMEQQEITYVYYTKTLLHPQNMLVRDKELKKLTVEQLNERYDRLKEMIDEKRKAGGDSPEVKRLENLKTYIFNLSSAKLYTRDDREMQTPKIGEDMGEHFELLKKKRQEINHQQWSENLKGFAEGNEKRQKRIDKFLKPGTFEVESKDAKIWKGAGVKDREGTHASILEMAYLHRKQKTLADLDDPENEADLQKVRDDVERVLHDQNEADLADLFSDMVRGFIRQFSVVDGEAMYTQFTGIGKMMDSNTTKTVKGWGDKAAKNRLIGLMATDLYQISILNEKVTRLALSRLTKEELALYREAMCYADNVGGCLQTFFNQLKEVGLDQPKDITPDSVGALMDGETKTIQQQYAQKYAQMTTYYLGTFRTEEDELIGGAKKTAVVEKEGKKKKVPAAEPWKHIKGGGTYLQTSALIGGDQEAIYQYLRSDDAKSDLENELQIKVNTDMLIDTSKIKIRLTADGTVEPPAD